MPAEEIDAICPPFPSSLSKEDVFLHILLFTEQQTPSLRLAMTKGVTAHRVEAIRSLRSRELTSIRCHGGIFKGGGRQLFDVTCQTIPKRRLVLPARVLVYLSVMDFIQHHDVYMRPGESLPIESAISTYHGRIMQLAFLLQSLHLFRL